jgi:hypothetical protein
MDWNPRASRASVPVPEASMDENHFAKTRKNKVRFARQILPM